MSCQFDRLSDCILLMLLEKLDSTSLYQLSRVNTRFQQLALENSLWKKIDARRAPNDEKKINYILDRVHGSTDMLLLKGRRAYPRVVDMIQLNTFSKLTILALQNQIISRSNGVKISDFPKSLVELSFKNSFFESSGEFFRKGFEAMENLKVLIIDGCSNISCSVIMSVSKYPNLEIFSCYKCPIENSVAYFSIAVSNGFKKIKVFDVRLSGLGNTFLTAMMKKANILMLYFQNRDTSYELDFRNRAEEASRKNIPVPKVRFRTLPVTGNEEILITDFGTLEFSRTAVNFEERKIPKSYLYAYPYLPCTCGFKDRQKECNMIMDNAESSQLMTVKRVNERKLVEIINEEECSDEESTTDKENGNVDGYSERGNSTGNFSTRTGQSSDNKRDSKQRTLKGTSRSSSSDVNSHLDPQDPNSQTSRACTEIIYRVFSKKKTTKDQSLETESTNDSHLEAPDDDEMATGDSCNTQDQPKDNAASNAFSSDHPSTAGSDSTNDPRSDAKDDEMETEPGTGSCSSQDQPNHSGVNSVNCADLPSTSGMSVPLRKRKLSSRDEEGGKRLKRNDSSIESSSSSDDDEEGKRGKDGKVKINSPFHLSSSDREDPGTPGVSENEQADGKILYISRGNVSSKRISDAISTYLKKNRPRQVTESGNGSGSNDPSTSRPRRRDIALLEYRGGRDVQPARTQVYPCACGNHSVIVVTADEAVGGDGPPLNPPENHFHPLHCEQRINLNDRQSLRVINRNENANARPEIELVEINKDKSLKSGLRHISFRGYHRVTDLTLKNVEHLQLELIDVTYTRCTKKGILDFLRLNPNCRVLHKNFCVCKPRMDF